MYTVLVSAGIPTIIALLLHWRQSRIIKEWRVNTEKHNRANESVREKEIDRIWKEIQENNNDQGSMDDRIASLEVFKVASEKAMADLNSAILADWDEFSQEADERAEATSKELRDAIARISATIDTLATQEDVDAVYDYIGKIKMEIHQKLRIHDEKFHKSPKVDDASRNSVYDKVIHEVQERIKNTSHEKIVDELATQGIKKLKEYLGKIPKS